MLLGALASLQWYGPAAGAMVTDTPVTTPQLSVSGLASGELDVVITNPTPNLKATRLVNSPLEVQGIGVMQEATPKGRARALLSVSIGAVPSAFDIAQAVWLQQITAVDVAGTTAAKLNDSGGGGGGGSSGGGTIIREDELAQGGTNFYLTLNSAASSINNIYINNTLVIMSGTGAGQSRRIKGYNGISRRAYVSEPWYVIPDNTSIYRMIPSTI